jgi:DNA-binding transcriptional MerR regulator
MHIGELARRTGLSVKTVRYYSDLGLVPEATRTRSGHRRYDATATLRLDFVRTLRELGLDLATIRRVLDREADLAAVAAAHASALDTQIRLLRVQRAVLRNLARRSQLKPAEAGHQPALASPITEKEVDRMNRIAQATADERRRLISEFLDSIFAGIPVDPQFEAGLRSVTPELPDNPTDEQVDAWIELAELVADPDFRVLLRRMGEGSFASTAPSALPRGEGARAMATLVTQRAGAALEAGVDPAAPEADPVLDELVGAFAAATDRTDDAAYRRELLAEMEKANDPRPERYWQLMAIINGWPPFPATTPAWSWTAHALRARLPRLT